MADPLIAFESRIEPPGLELRVNFGMFAGREATAAELDELAAVLVPEVGQVSVVAEHRHEVGAEAESSLHQVRIEVAPERVPATEQEREELTDKLLDLAQDWAQARIAERHTEV
jgi:hypothetical protein